ncbi:MAG: SprT family zinc-dependent metalloprotease [Pseudomonadota bacterium]
MIKKLSIADVSIDVVFKDIKNVHLSVYPPTGRVRVSAPHKMDLETIRLFAVSKINWIRKNQKKVLNQERETPREYIERESHYLWGNRYLLRIKDNKCTDVKVDNRHIELPSPKGSTFDYRKKIFDEFYRKELRQEAHFFIGKWEKRLGVKVERFYIQRMKTKWGSSSPKKNIIRLNLDLAKFPKECLNYIVLHEMAHFLVPNHGEAFINILDANLPDWQTIRENLNKGPLTTLA